MYDRFHDPRHIKWAKTVKKRDRFTCQVCNARNIYLNSHHKNSWDIFEQQRFNVDNGITLCNCCHDRFHYIYGAGRNTEYQFNEYCRITKLIYKIAKCHIDGYK